MRVHSVAILVVLAASFAVAQETLCDATSALAVSRDGSVIVQKITLRGKWGRNEATVYLPDKEIAEGAVVFSHSTIHEDNGASVDLLPFALTLAHAGAAVIVPERSLIWPPNDAYKSNREGSVVVCAEHWLIDHTKVFNDGKPIVNDKNIVVREGYAYLGPRVCDPGAPTTCNLTDPFAREDAAIWRYYRPSMWVPVGETEGGDNTSRLISDGGLQAARWLQKGLGLAPITVLIAGPTSSGSSSKTSSFANDVH